MFTPEDGTGLADANSYIDVATADAYFLDRANTVWAALTTEAKQAALIQASDYIDARFGQRFYGTKLVTDQGLELPRDPTTAPYTGIPATFKKAVAEYAVRASQSPLAPDLQNDPTGYQISRKMEQAGPLMDRTDYAIMGPGSSRTYFNSYPGVDILMRPYLRSDGRTIIRN
jgi:hypothetical protein